MESNQNNTDTDTKKQSVVSSTKINVFADEDTEKGEKQHQDLPRPILKPANPNVLADASNKLEAQQEDEQQDPQLTFKKKKRGYYKNKKYYKNKNRNAWNPAANKNDNNNDVRDPRNRDYHQPYQRGNNQAYFPHEEANAFAANHNDPSQFQQPFSRYVPGSHHEFPIPHPPHPQPQRHLFADDGNAKVLLEQYGNNGVVADDRDFVPNDNDNVNGPEGNNWVAAAPVSNHHPPFSWVDMIDNSTQLDGVVIMHGGLSKFVPLAPDVGACLVKELLVQKENFQESVHHNHDPNAYASVGSEQVHENAGGAQGQAPPPMASTDHPAFPVVQRGSVPSSVTTSGHPRSLSYPHQRPNNHPDQSHHYNVHAPIFNPQQPYNGFGSLPAPAPDSNYGMHIAPPPSQYPMLQYPQMYSQMGMPGPAAAPHLLGGVIPGYARPNDFYADGQHNGSASGAAMRGEIYVDDQRRGDGRHPASNNRNNREPNRHRAGIHQGDATEGGNRPHVHHHNQNAVTPHRDAVRGNGHGHADPRRVSFSPMPRALSASAGCNM